jgi:hypothetical protein
MQLRVEPDVYEAIDRVAPRGLKNAYITKLIRRDLQRRRELPAPARKARAPKHGRQA